MWRLRDASENITSHKKSREDIAFFKWRCQNSWILKSEFLRPRPEVPSVSYGHVFGLKVVWKYYRLHLAIFKMEVLLYKQAKNSSYLLWKTDSEHKEQDSRYKNQVKSKSNASAIFWAKSDPAIFSRRSRQHKNESLSMARMRIIIQARHAGSREGWGAGGHAPPDFGKSVNSILTRGVDFAPTHT